MTSNDNGLPVYFKCELFTFEHEEYPMRYTVEQLENDPRFRQTNRLGYEGILQFVMENIRKVNIASRTYLFINVLYLVFLIAISITGFFIQGYHTGPYISSLFWGILAGSFAIIPFHEAFHGLAYKIIGAPVIHFGADLKQMLFYVAADRYVVGRREFYFIALAPFIAINLITIGASLFLAGYWHIFFTVFLLFHNIMCIGDFAMMSYFMQYPEKELYTFDDHKNRISYIYERSRENGESGATDL